MEIPVVRVAGTCTASREAIAGDGNGIIFTAGAGAVRLEITESGSLQSPIFFHLPRKRLQLNSSGQRFPWDKQQGPVVIGESCSEDAKAKAKDKVNTASCVVASPGAVAIGETGYLPRVIVYSKTAQPLAVIQEHQFGVQHLQFSPSGRYLATLGTPNDGYLYIWEIDLDTVASQASSGVLLHSSNRCISQVHDIQWISETQLVTVGVRHIRVWTVEPTGNNGVLAGRNVVLGAQADATFACAVKLEGEKTAFSGDPGSPGGLSPFLVATRSGTILKVGPGLSTVLQTNMNVNCMSIYNNELVVAGDHVCKYNLDTFDEIIYDVSVTGVKSLAHSKELIFLTAQGLVTESGKALRAPLDEPLVGMRCCSDKFLSWTGHELSFWTDKLEPSGSIEFDFDINTVHLGTNLVVGGTEGQLSIQDEVFNAHAGPVTDVDGITNLVISAGRDRCLQIWTRQEPKWDLQTLPLLGPLTKARIVNAETIVTVVGGKTLQLHRLVDKDFVTEKTVMSKVLILDLIVSLNTIIVSTSDRQVLIYDTDGELKTGYRPLDIQNEPIALTHLSTATVEGGQYLIAAAADKSVCVYSHPQGQLLAAEWAHATSIKGIAVCKDRIVSYGDLIVERQLVKEAERPHSPMRSLSPVRSIRSSSPIRRPASPFRQSARSSSPTRVARPTTPTRPVPIRSASPKRSSPASPSRVASPRPLRLSSQAPKLAAMSGASSSSSQTSSSSQASQAGQADPVAPGPAIPAPAASENAVDALEKALEAYISSGESDPRLQPLLAKAMAQTSDTAFTALADNVCDEILKYVKHKLDL